MNNKRKMKKKEHKQQMLARMWGKGALILCRWECKLVQLLWRLLKS
jgi:hypothetical protein